MKWCTTTGDIFTDVRVIIKCAHCVPVAIFGKSNQQHIAQ